MRQIGVQVFMGLVLVVTMGAGRVAAQGNAPATPPPPALALHISAFSDGGDIPARYGCDVAAGAPMVTPGVTWTNPPKAAASFVLIVHDTDNNPMKGILDVTHWTVYNIPGTATAIPEGITPDSPVDDSGMQGKNVRGANGYQGPCPPKGGPAHHYVFELYALDTRLDLPAGAARADLLKAMDGHIIGKSTYIGLFHRNL